MLSFITKYFSGGRSAPSDISSQMAAYNETRNGKDMSAFCFAPSINMYFSQDGYVKLCCHNMEYSIGKYPDQSISEIWNSPAAEKIRQDMRAYKLYDGCNICKADIDLGAFQEVRARHFDTLPVNKQYPTMMEFLLTNTCNLECVMCKGEFSSLIRQNREKLAPIPNAYDDQFIEQLREFIPHLREARFSGSGEAFLIDVNYKIWEMILELNPTCIIMVQTNGMVLNSRIKELMNRGNFQIGVSLDSLKKEVFEAIRPHAKLQRVLENIEYFNSYAKSKKIKFSIALCVMRQNWRELADFVHFANSMDATATFHKVYHPIEYSMRGLAQQEIQEAIDYLTPAMKTFATSTYLQRQNAKHFEYIIDSLKDWKKDALPVIVDQQTDEDLIRLVLDKSYVYIKGEFKDPAQAEGEYRSFKEKFDSVMDRLTLEGRDKKLLKQMYKTDSRHIFSYFKQYSENELYEISVQAEEEYK